MIVETFLSAVFAWVRWVISWIPVISVPQLVTYDFSALWNGIAIARFLMPVEAYLVVLAMWGVVWGVRLAMVPVRWLVAWFGR